METKKQKVSEGDSTIVESISSEPVISGVKTLKRHSFARWFTPFLLLFLGVVISLNRSSVNSLFRSMINLNYLNLLHRDQHFRYNLQNLLLAVLFILSGAFFSQQVLEYIFDLKIVFWKIIFVITLIYLLRHVVMQLVSYAFEDNIEIKQLGYTIFLFNLVLGVLLVPIDLLLAFGQSSVASFSLYSGIILFSVLYLYRLLRGFLLFGSQIVSNKLRFFTYLCALEIAPILLIIKIIQRLGT